MEISARTARVFSWPLKEPLACLVTCPMEDMNVLRLMFAKDHSLAMANRSWGRSGTRTAFGRSEAEHLSGRQIWCARSATARGNLLAAMVSGRAGRAHRFKPMSGGMVFEPATEMIDRSWPGNRSVLAT